MARVSNVESSSLTNELAVIYERFATEFGPFRNQVGVLAHMPPVIEHLLPMLMTLSENKNVPRRYIELAVVTVSKLNACAYCISHHTPQLEVAGISLEGVERILDYQEHPEFSEIDRLVVEFSIAVTETPQRIRDELFDRLREHFRESQIVELTFRIALCGFYNRFNDALMIETEPELLS
jgi:uncharacterized peroxidase-related enzyme